MKASSIHTSPRKENHDACCVIFQKAAPGALYPRRGRACRGPLYRPASGMAAAPSASAPPRRSLSLFPRRAPTSSNPNRPAAKRCFPTILAVSAAGAIAALPARAAEPTPSVLARGMPSGIGEWLAVLVWLLGGAVLAVTLWQRLHPPRIPPDSDIATRADLAACRRQCDSGNNREVDRIESRLNAAIALVDAAERENQLRDRRVHERIDRYARVLFRMAGKLNVDTAEEIDT